MKSEFLQTIKMNLLGQMEPESIRLVADVVTLALENYELIEKCTAVIPYEGAADELMFKKFMASKLILGFSPRFQNRHERSTFLRAATLHQKEIASYRRGDTLEGTGQKVGN